MTIPSELGDMPVAVIDQSAFSGCRGLTSITIPDSVRIIGRSAFSGCSALSRVTMSGSLLKIEDKAFYGCSKLQVMEFTGNISNLGKDVFPKGDCKAILPEGNSTYPVVNGKWQGMKVEWRKKSSLVPVFETRKALSGPLSAALGRYGLRCAVSTIAAIDTGDEDRQAVNDAIADLEKISESLAKSENGDEAAAKLAELNDSISRYRKVVKISDEDALNSCLCLLSTRVCGKMSNEAAKSKVKAEMASLKERAAHGEEYYLLYFRETKLASLPVRPQFLAGAFSRARIPDAWEKKSANATAEEKEAFKQAFLKSTAMPMLKADCAIIDAACKIVKANSKAEAQKQLAKIDNGAKELAKLSCQDIGQYAYSPLQKALNSGRIVHEQAKFLEELADMAVSQDVAAVIKKKAAVCAKAATAAFAKAQKLCLSAKPPARGSAKLYMVVDISGGPNAKKYPVTYLNSVPKGGVWPDEYKTTKIVLRRIDPGEFTMGSPADEIGRYACNTPETQHKVTITKPFYIGVFEITQKQYELVTGKTPSSQKGDMRPVDNIAWDTIRGSPSVNNWPVTSEVDPSTFMGILRAKTGMSTFDLPTEAQWEYACRAGTTTALNNGKNLTNLYTDPSMDDLGRYGYNNGYQAIWDLDGRFLVDGRGGCPSHHAIVGSYLPNAWGLYDMHGNVYEWCLDAWVEDLTANPATDPIGPVDVANGGRGPRMLRGGDYSHSAAEQRSARRYPFSPFHERSCRNYLEFGFRLCFFTEPPIRNQALL